MKTNHPKWQMAVLFFLASQLFAGETVKQQADGPDLQIKNTNVMYNQKLDLLIFNIQVHGEAGKTTPAPAGKLDGAPVLGYVIPTTLKPAAVGFGEVEGIVALAVTSHPDFDDTPLWDENADRNYDNDGVVWHPHWVILIKDTRVAGGLAVKEFDKKDTTVVLPPTNPGMPMYMDSPGYPVVTANDLITILVPAYRVRHQTDFQYDAVTAYMQVNTSDSTLPLLGVYQVFSIASGNLSLPYSVQK